MTGVFWLDEARNYLPVAMHSYDARVSTTVLLGEVVVEQWLEVEPGIWFPKRAELRAFQRDQLREPGRQVLAWRHVCDVDSLSLRPNHPLSFFQRVTFPQGTLVYEFENGRQIRSYRVGTPNDPNVVSRRSRAV